MATSVKGFLKGLRYISQIFDEKEPEMQIGCPTDVKHVAHIGWDGPSANNSAPSWMNEFKPTPEISSAVLNSIGGIDLPSANNNMQAQAQAQDQAQGTEELKIQKTSRAPKTKRQSSTDTSPSLDSSMRRCSEKGSRRNRSTCPSEDSPTIQDSSGNSQSSRHHRGLDESSSENPSALPKHSHRRRSRNSSEGGSTRSSRRSKGRNSLTDIPLPALEIVEEEKNSS